MNRLSAALEKIKHHHRQHVSINFPAPGVCISRCSQKWPCEAYQAAAALDAVLKQASEWEMPSATRPLVRREYAAEVFRAAITRGLFGEDPGGTSKKNENEQEDES